MAKPACARGVKKALLSALSPIFCQCEIAIRLEWGGITRRHMLGVISEDISKYSIPSFESWPRLRMLLSHEVV